VVRPVDRAGTAALAERVRELAAGRERFVAVDGTVPRDDERRLGPLANARPVADDLHVPL